MKTNCPECYSDDNRATPLIDPLHCLENHTQYICGTCGRCICIDKDRKRNLQRWNFPFNSLEIAKLYLRTAIVSTQKACGIYEITGTNGRKTYKIFSDNNDLHAYLKKNRGKRCEQMQPLFVQDNCTEYSEYQIRRLTAEEVKTYIQEQPDNTLIYQPEL